MGPCQVTTPPPCQDTTPPPCQASIPPLCQITTLPPCQTTTPPTCQHITPPPCRATTPPPCQMKLLQPPVKNFAVDTFVFQKRMDSLPKAVVRTPTVSAIWGWAISSTVTGTVFLMRSFSPVTGTGKCPAVTPACPHFQHQRRNVRLFSAMKTDTFQRARVRTSSASALVVLVMCSTAMMDFSSTPLSLSVTGLGTTPGAATLPTQPLTPT